MKVIILAGGSGTRLWPISRRSFPKQFLNFGDGQSLLQKTIRRFAPLYKTQDLLIVTNQEYFHLVKNQVKEIDPSLEDQIIVEPEKRNTAPAILLAIRCLQERKVLSEEESILVSSSDHLISPEKGFLNSLSLAEQLTQQGVHVTFGIRPNKPETGYGYIQIKESDQELASCDVQRFVEKPDAARAQEYILSGNYLWNSGIFAFQVKTLLEDLKNHCLELTEKASCSYEQLLEGFSELPNISIDYALMEKSKRIKVIPLNITWSDVGSWDSVYEILDKDEHQNVKIGNVIDIDTKNCLIMGGKRLIATVGLEEMLIVETDDALFLGKRGESQRVKALVDELKKRKAKEPEEHTTMYRPWGKYTTLEEGWRYKIKRIVVDPCQKLSLQMHYHRSEHWVVVKGTAKVRINDTESLLHENESIFVPQSALHRLENPGKVSLEIIEVQVGEYLGEDDIIRYDDIYSRECATAAK